MWSTVLRAARRATRAPTARCIRTRAGIDAEAARIAAAAADSSTATATSSSNVASATAAVSPNVSSSASSSSGSDSPAFSFSPPSDFLRGMSDLINASRRVGTSGLYHMAAQERRDMDSHLALPQRMASSARSTPLTPIEAASAASDPSGGSAAAAAAAAKSAKPKPTNPFPPILPFESFWSVTLPFDSDSALYDDYVRFDGGVRFERILEDLDAFAGNVAHLHVKQGVLALEEQWRARVQRGEAGADERPPHAQLPPFSIVTASVDGITLNPRLRFPMDKTLAMQGAVTWVGRSSMEVWIEIRAVRDPKEWATLSLADKMARSGAAAGSGSDDDVVLSAYFMMVARDQVTGKAAFVPPLDLSRMGEADRARFERGERAAVRRKQEAAESLTTHPPTADEVALIHSTLMLGTGATDAAGATGTAGAAGAAGAGGLELAPVPAGAGLPAGAVILRAKSVQMSETEMSSSSMTQPQDRNTNGKIFGGHLMRHAYELARCTSYLFCGANSAPFVTAVGHISFLRPVEIGSIISFHAKVAYAAGHPDPAFQVRVETRVHDLTRGALFSSNTFDFTFHSPSVPVRRVLPKTYQEAVEWIDGKRRRERLARELASAEQARGGGGAGGFFGSTGHGVHPPQLKQPGLNVVTSTQASVNA